jgi:predicted permease
MSWWSRLKNAINLSDQDSGLQTEMETHMALLEADELQRGASPEEARQRARKRFGGSLNNRNRAREGGFFGWMVDFAQDLRFTLRQFAHAPSFVVTTTLLLGLGIGVNAAIFTLLNSVVLHSLPLPHPDRLVVMLEEMAGGGDSPPSWLDLKDFREQNHVFESVAAYAYDAGFLLGTDGETRRVIGGYVTPDYFPTLEVAPVMGRLFDAHDAEPGNNAVALVREDFWRNDLNADPMVIGREVELNGQKAKIIGVLPRSFRFPFDTTVVWSPLIPKPNEAGSRGFHGFPMIGRLRPGVTVKQATVELSAIMKRLSTAYPDADPERVNVLLFPLQRWSVGQSANRLVVLQCAAFAIFLMTCANVSSLLLTRYAGRRREFALRAALGASSMRQMRQHLTESLLLAGIGCALGIAIAYEGVAFLLRLYGTTLPRAGEIHVDGRLALFTIGVTLAGAIVFGLTTALHSRSRQLDMELREGGRSAGSRPGAFARKFLVAAQVASAVTLMAGASELIRTFQALTSVDAGFRPDDLLTMRISLPEKQYTKPRQVSNFFDRVVNLVSALPQVKAAATINLLPLQQSGYNGGISVPGLPLPPKSLVVEYRWIDGDFFRVMGIPLLRGRTFLPEEATGERPNAIINEALAWVLWGEKDPINWPIDTSVNPARVVGVARDTRESELEHPARPAMYFPLASRSAAQTEESLVVRSSIPPATLASLIRSTVRGVDSQAAIYRVKPMREVVEDSVGYARITATLLSLMASLALVLAAFGLYGVLSFAVEERMREFAIRTAVGAKPAQLVGLVFGQSLGIVGIGLAFGLAGVWMVTQVLPNVLYGVHRVDAASLVVSLGVLTAAAMLAIAVPAWRATRVDPILMLRQD